MPSISWLSPVPALMAATLPAHAQTNLAAIYQEAQSLAQGRWIEVDSNRPESRAFLAMSREAGAGSLKRVHLRYDRGTTSKEPGPPTIVHTVDLDCWRSQTTLIALHGFDRDGTRLFSEAAQKQQPELVLNFYASPLRLVCSGEYLLPLVKDGEALYNKARRMAREAAVADVPDRPIPLID